MLARRGDLCALKQYPIPPALTRITKCDHIIPTIETLKVGRPVETTGLYADAGVTR